MQRHPIKESPRDGTAIILEDDASGTYDVAHWSTKADQWLGENGEPTKITPTHWYPLARDQYLLREDERSRKQSRRGRARRLAVSSITLTLVATVLVVTHFRAEVMAYVARYAGHEDKLITAQESRSANQGSLISNSVALQRAEADQTTAPAEAQQAARVQQTAVVSVPEAQLSLKADRAEAAAQEPDETRRAIEGLDVQRWAQAEAAQSARSLEEEGKKAAALALEVTAARKELTASTAQYRQAMDEERARSAALASELEMTRREIETQAAQSQKAFGEAVQQKQAAEAAIAHLQQSLQQEQKKTAALMQEAKAAQATMTAAEPQRRALDEAQARAAALASELAGTQREIETRATQSQKAVDVAVQQKQAAETTAAELRRSLQQERDKTSAMARDLASMQRPTGESVAVRRSANGSVVPVTRAANSESPKAAGGLGNEEAAKLIALASALLSQGNIGAARIVLERASESGNAKASFMLAETYDPVILSAWGTRGTRGEAAKAREYYAKAHTGGIQEAKHRTRRVAPVRGSGFCSRIDVGKRLPLAIKRG